MNITDRVDKREYTYFVECLKTSLDTFVLATLAVIWDRVVFLYSRSGAYSRQPIIPALVRDFLQHRQV